MTSNWSLNKTLYRAGDGGCRDLLVFYLFLSLHFLNIFHYFFIDFWLFVLWALIVCTPNDFDREKGKSYGQGFGGKIKGGKPTLGSFSVCSLFGSSQGMFQIQTSFSCSTQLTTFIIFLCFCLVYFGLLNFLYHDFRKITFWIGFIHLRSIEMFNPLRILHALQVFV